MGFIGTCTRASMTRRDWWPEDDVSWHRFGLGSASARRR